ncbi:hypothetical protein [Ferroplasma acidiphilum]|nr:hypothetical protein [Ferroplasma acidiphilum]WMT52871.1 MAG: hypothetical protein RE473_07630 [Ferroplasma acidiphilum]
MLMIYILLPVAIVGLTILIAGLHMVAPDHWTPILSYSLQKKFRTGKIGTMSFSLGLIHGIFSSILSFGIAILGMYFLPEFYLKIFAVALLVFVALYIILNAMHEKKSEDSRGGEIEKSILLVSIIPDPAIVPIILIAVVYGIHFVYITLIIFVLASALALLLVTLLLSKILMKKLATFTPQKIDYLVAIILLLTTLFVLF